MNKENLKKKGAIAFVIAILLSAFYYFAQIMGWINVDNEKDTKTSAIVKQVETQNNLYK